MNGEEWSNTVQSLQLSKPGETLGASMLSRISSGGESDLSLGGSARKSLDLSNNSPLAQIMANKPPNPILSQNASPLAQMMARMPAGARQQQPSSIMGRRVHTVSAGLAYGSAGFSVDPKTRLSKFDLKKADNSALSISSGGGNAEWG
jgi:hypothetical protein